MGSQRSTLSSLNFCLDNGEYLRARIASIHITRWASFNQASGQTSLGNVNPDPLIGASQSNLRLGYQEEYGGTKTNGARIAGAVGLVVFATTSFSTIQCRHHTWRRSDGNWFVVSPNGWAMECVKNPERSTCRCVGYGSSKVCEGA